MSVTIVLALVIATAAQGAMAAAASAAETSANPQRAAATAACERAVQATLRDTRGTAAAPTFKTPPSVVPAPADAPEMTLRGAGQVRSGAASRNFSYSCNYDLGTASVSGVVVRDSVDAPAPRAARAVEPDLSHVSPTACESAAAAELKRRWPGVTQINFNPATRKLSQDTDGIASLRGQGSAAPTVRGPDVHFSYDCAIDARNGRVMKMAIGS
jgi:hypothetical protein